MRLDFDCVTITDFKSFKGEHVFQLRDFDAGLHYMRGRNLVGKRLGSNGAGKSTIWDAVCWCLFGTTPGGLKNPDVKPWGFKGTTRVGLAITRGKEKHSIVRSINPNRLVIDRKDKGQEDVERLVMSFDLFVNTIMLAQGRPLFFDLSPKDKMQLFVDALQLDRWDERAVTATARVREMDMVISELNGEALGLASALETFKTLIKEETRKADAWDQDWKDRAKRAKKEIDVCEKDLEVAQKKRDEYDLAYDSAETELRALEKQFDDVSIEADKAQRRYDDADREDRSNKSACLELKKKIEGLGSGDRCDMCGQSLKGTSLEKHRKELKAALRKREAVAKEGIPLDICNDVDVTQGTLDRIKHGMRTFRDKANEAKDLLDTYDRKVAEHKGNLAALRKALETKEQEVNPHRAQIRVLTKRQKETENSLEDLAIEHDLAEKKLTRAKYWTKGFKDIRLYVLEEVMQELELATNAMLDEAGLVGWRVSYILERETQRGTVSRGLTILVRSPQSHGDVKWESWSGGEQQRLRIVGALALSEVLLNHAGIETSLEVLDEPTQHLSGAGVKDLCEYLADRAERLDRKIFYVDHQSVESTRFGTVTRIERDKGGSRIVITAF